MSIIRPSMVQSIRLGSEIARGLGGYWPLDEGGGDTAFDRSGYGNNGSFVGTVTWNVDDKGTSLRFDGSGDYVQIANSDILATKNTVAFWFRVPGGWSSAKSDSQHVWNHRTNGGDFAGSFGWLSEANGTLNFSIDTGPGSSSVASTITSWADQWYHAAMVTDSTNMLLYVDGTYNNHTAYTGTITPGSNTLNLWSNRAGASLNVGLLSDFVVLNRALTASEAKSLYIHGIQSRRDPIDLWAAATVGGGGTSYQDEVNVQTSVQSSATDTTALNDDVSVSTTISASVTDISAFTDGINSTVTTSSSVDDVYTPNGATAYFDEVNVSVTCGSSVVDTLTVTDDVSVSVSTTSEITDMYGFVDEVNCSTSIDCEVTDTLAYSDDVTATVTVSNSATDGVSFYDAVNTQCNVQCEVTDSFIPISGYMISVAFLMLKKHR